MLAPPLMLVHGWGFSSRIWQPLIQAVDARWPGPVYALDLPGFGTAFHEPCGDLDAALAFMLAQLPARSVLCGWSLGGMLATALAHRHPERVAGLVTLASNLHFTREGDWPGMPVKDYRDFCERFNLTPERTWKQFLTLQTRGDLYSGQYSPVLQQLASYDNLDPDMAAKLLGLLGQIDNRALFPQLRVPGLHLFGEHDVITPVAVAERLPALHPEQAVQVLPAACHALCITRADDIAERLQAFARQVAQPAPPLRTRAPARSPTAAAAPPAARIPRSQIARSFSSAAHLYDSAAGLQRQVADALLEQVDLTERGVTLDAGSGTGYLAQALRPHSTQCIALDLAPGMLQVVRAHCGPFVSLLQADMQQLPLADESMDRIVSSLALQWCERPEAFFRECRRVLRPGGFLHVSTFLPGTLCELRDAWLAVDQDEHVNRFTDLEALLDGLSRAGFRSVEATPTTLRRHYADLHALARELKAIGAHNMNPGRPRGLTGRRRWQQLQAAYEARRTPEGLPATYEVLHVLAH